jgi:hypothetical protein
MYSKPRQIEKPHRGHDTTSHSRNHLIAGRPPTGSAESDGANEYIFASTGTLSSRFSI